MLRGQPLPDQAYGYLFRRAESQGRVNCSCHGEPMYWQADRKRKAGGWWLCAVKRRKLARDRYHDRHRAQKLQRQRERYDSDPIYRIEKRLKDDARKRRATIVRRRAALRADTSGCVTAAPRSM